MKAALLLIAIVGAASMASALKVQGSLRDEFFQYTSAELMAPLNDVIKEIDIEKQDDLNNIAHAKTSQKMMETQEAAAKAALDKATAAKDAELAKWQKTQADLLQREKEYAANDETRTQEEGVSKTIEQDFVKLAGVGPADGTIGIMPESRLLNAGKPTDAPVAAVSFGAKQEAMEALQVSVQALASISTRPEAKELLNLIQQGRKSGKITDGEDTLLKIKKSIADERKKDTDAVEAQKKVVKAAARSGNLVLIFLLLITPNLLVGRRLPHLGNLLVELVVVFPVVLITVVLSAHAAGDPEDAAQDALHLHHVFVEASASLLADLHDLWVALC